MPNKKKTDDSEKHPTMTVAEVSEYLSLSPRSVYKLVGDLPAIRVGGRWHFRLSDVERWLLKQRKATEPQAEPVQGVGSRHRIFSHMSEANIFLDVPETKAPALIRGAIERASLNLTESPEAAAKEKISSSIMQREALCSTALHPEVAFPHPREPEKCPLGDDRIVVVRAAQPVDFAEIHGYRPRMVFILLARKASTHLLWEARLSHLLHREGFVKKLLSAGSPREMYRIFASSSEGADTARRSA